MYENLNAKEIRKVHFDIALCAMVPSVSDEQIAFFESFRLHSGVSSI